MRSFKAKKFFFLTLILSFVFLITIGNIHSVIAIESTTPPEEYQEKTKVSDQVLNQAEESAVVQGADGLLYVVADKSDKEQLISSDTPQIAEKTEGDFTAVEVGIDEKRQEKADQADQEIKDFDEIDLDDVESLQSAVNKDDVELLISKISEEDIFCLDYWKTFFINSKDTLPGTTITFSFMSLCLSLCSLVLAISNITIPGQPKEESQLLAIGFVVFVLSMIILVATVNVRDKRLEKYTASIYLLTKAIEKNQNESVRP